MGDMNEGFLSEVHVKPDRTPALESSLESWHEQMGLHQV